jgi:uncharacterized protein with GYD domain
MPTYIMLLSWTEHGAGKIKESPSRLDAFKQALQQAGGSLKGFYLVTGRYDMVAVVEVPDEETVAKLALATGSKGSTRTETLRAFNEDEYRRIISELP